MRYADQPAHYCCYPSAHADEQREFESLTSREHVRSSETLLPLQTSTTKCPSFSFATALALGSLMRVSAQFAADRPQDGLLIVDLFFFLPSSSMLTPGETQWVLMVYPQTIGLFEADSHKRRTMLTS
jgi:hypothetical protein